MTPIRNINRLLVATMLVLSAFVVTTLPAATAHVCTGVDPARNCGECDDGLPHNHRYVNGSTYCNSFPVFTVDCEELTRSVDTKYDVCNTDVVVTPVEPSEPSPVRLEDLSNGALLLP